VFVELFKTWDKKGFMVAAGFAQKLGMTHMYVSNRHVAVTVLKMPEQVIISHNPKNDTSSTLQIGAVTKKNVAKPQRDELTKKEITAPISKRKEVVIATSEVDKIGTSLTVANFIVGDNVVISGTSKGKGFSGGIKRHGWSRGPMSHGSKHHRAPGSIGSGYPQRVVPGKRLPGHKGSEVVTIKGNKIMAINEKDNTMAISGAIPGPNKSFVFINKTGATG
jgi:large subunit ribosomal protein L3